MVESIMKIDIKSLFNRAKSAWIDLMAKVKSLFARSNKNNAPLDISTNDDTQIQEKEAQAGHLENERDYTASELDEELFYDAVETLSELDEGETLNLEDPRQNEDDDEQIIWHDAVENIEENVNIQLIYGGNKFYSANKDLQEVDKITDHEKTFAIALFDHKTTKHPDVGASLDGGILNKLTDFQFINGKCALKFGQLGVEFGHIRLFMPFFFEKRTQISPHDLFQYTDKDDKKHTPSIVMLLDKPESFNLDPTFASAEELGWGYTKTKVKFFDYICTTAWNHIKESEANKSTRISSTMLPTFTMNLLEGQNLSLSINQGSISDIMEDLRKEKSTVNMVYYLAGSLFSLIINCIIDKVTSKQEKTNFHIRDILMNGTMINELQKQTNGQGASSSELNGQCSQDISSTNLELINIKRVMKNAVIHST
ncbi:Hypothetical protein CINCED_3A018854 [Cinara cedri]|uniref:Uncharacterized protein n=1 Tax=Cinara cedri TaxID=506608 RepID=A0A5E4N4R3_9HEMI|nr:Hypothetical protein CINCED_3A018854 [Cinara cedri]